MKGRSLLIRKTDISKYHGDCYGCISFSVCNVCVCVCVYRSVLAKAIHSLSRIGEDLYVEPQEDEVRRCYRHQHFLPPCTQACCFLLLHTLHQ